MGATVICNEGHVLKITPVATRQDVVEAFQVLLYALGRLNEHRV